MVIFWIALVTTNQILPEQIPWAISFHLAGEFATPILLIVSGVGLWKSKGWTKITNLMKERLGELLMPTLTMFFGQVFSSLEPFWVCVNVHDCGFV